MLNKCIYSDAGGCDGSPRSAEQTSNMQAAAEPRVGGRPSLHPALLCITGKQSKGQAELVRRCGSVMRSRRFPVKEATCSRGGEEEEEAQVLGGVTAADVGVHSYWGGSAVVLGSFHILQKTGSFHH